MELTKSIVKKYCLNLALFYEYEFATLDYTSLSCQVYLNQFKNKEINVNGQNIDFYSRTLGF